MKSVFILKWHRGHCTCNVHVLHSQRSPAKPICVVIRWCTALHEPSRMNRVILMTQSDSSVIHFHLFYRKLKNRSCIAAKECGQQFPQTIFLSVCVCECVYSHAQILWKLEQQRYDYGWNLTLTTLSLAYTALSESLKNFILQREKVIRWQLRPTINRVEKKNQAKLFLELGQDDTEII